MDDDQKQREPESTPPGQFVSDDLRTETANFLDELRKRLKRMKDQSEPKLGPSQAPSLKIPSGEGSPGERH
jgi:hypothetical protein